jgi:hypothetical protein
VAAAYGLQAGGVYRARWLMSNPSIQKRQKERDRQEYQRAKAEKRKQRREDRGERPTGAPGEDPDLAGIVPGPQPPAEE